MAEPSVNPRILRFGLFEVDLHARELRKAGIRVKLHQQPFEILAMLLEQPGQVVSREELQKRLWPADTFVDFDLSLNSAVKKLRQALNDDSDNPRFIETLYRRGYRFIGPVSTSSGSARPLTPVFVMPEAAPLPASPTVRLGSGWKSRALVLATVLALIGVGIALLQRPAVSMRVLGYRQITHDGLPKMVVVTDGERLYLTEMADNRIVIAQVSANGGETAILPTPFTNIFIGDIAWNGSALLAANFKGTGGVLGLWRLSLPVGTPQRVGDILPSSATWSPDGNQLAYAVIRTLYLANADASDPRPIISVSGDPTGLQFSPDGHKLRFDLNNLSTGSSEIWEVNVDGSDLHAVLPRSSVPSNDCCGRWTRDGQYFVFQRFRDGVNNIWVLPESHRWSLRKREPVQLTNGPLAFSSPTPGVGGRQIFAVGVNPRAEVVRYDVQAGFVPYFANSSVTDLAFSPDGQWLAYVTIPERTLWRSRLDGSQPLQLSPTSLPAGLPKWSPDGKQIVFMARTYSTNYHAYLIPASGGNMEELVRAAEAGFDPNWSADGKSIVLTLTDPSDQSGLGISVVDVASRKTSQLPGSAGYFSPRCSPDGKYILAISKDSMKLALFDLATQRWSDLVGAELGAKGYPTWSRDGQYVYFDTVFNDSPAFFRVRVSDRKVEKLFNLTGLHRYLGEFGSWSGLAPDDTPLLVRDIGSQEIYALDWAHH
jgi:Tol biopolymer transport system component/DNA-binding winged helix-turn-helix (wHTH) protein